MFGWGAVGGLMPTLGKIAGAIGANFEVPVFSFWGVVAAMVIYALIGCVMARAMGEVEMKQALIAGIAAPAILTNVFNGATEGKIKLTDLFFLGHAMAQTPSSAPNTGNKVASDAAWQPYRTVTFDPNVPGASGAMKKPITVRILVPDKEGNAQEWYSGQLNSSTTNTTIAVPKSQAHIIFDGRVNLVVPASPDNVTVDVDITSKSSFADGFWWALGGQPANRVEVKASIASPHGQKPQP
jgi:hypothetical protein